MIDWVLGSITFRSQLLKGPVLSPTSSARSAPLPSWNPQVPEIPLSAEHPRVALIGAAAFALASKQSGSQCFKIHLSFPSIFGNSASIPEAPPDLSHVPEEYHDFADVFNKAKADTLAPHRPYDLKIEIEEGASPPIGPMFPI